MQQIAIHEQIIYLVHQVRDDHPGMGMRDLYYRLLPDGIGRNAFEELCKVHNLYVRKPSVSMRTKDSRGVSRFENKLKGLRIDHINQVWQSDITYFEVQGRFYFLTFIQDTYTKRIIGHSTSKSLKTEETTYTALKMAIRNRRGQKLEGLILHSDGGGQYYDKEFLALTQKYCMYNSMAEYAWENGMAERLNGVIKNNYLQYRKCKSFTELAKEVDRSVLLYNYEKPHKMLQKKSPMQFEKLILPLVRQTPQKMTKSLDANLKGMGHRVPSL
jgi:putative transposase